LDNTRGPVPKTWGTADNEDYQRHLLMGLPGMGPVLAKQIMDKVGMPLTWSTQALAALASVPGVGPKKIEAWLRAVPAVE
jgi:ERCC4-type nuclease